MIEQTDLKFPFTLNQWCKVKYKTYAFFQPNLGSMYATEMQTRLYQKSYPLNKCPITRGLFRIAFKSFEEKKGILNLDEFLLVSHNALVPERIEFKRVSTRYIICLSECDSEIAFDTQVEKCGYLRVFKVPAGVNILLREHSDIQDTGVYLIGAASDYS